MGTGPVAGVVVALTQGLRQCPSGARSFKQISELQTNTLHLIGLPALQARQILHMGQGQVTVDLAGADMENTDHGKPLEARKHAGWSNSDFRGNKGDLVTQVDAEFGGGLVTQHHAKLAGLQIIQATLFEEVADDRDLGFFLRIDRIDQHFLHLAVVGQQALHLAKRCNRQHLRVALRLIGQAAPVLDRCGALNRGVRHHTEHTGAHFMVEAIHYRQHQNHHQHTKCQPDHRGQGNKGYEVVATLGPRVARADKYEQRSEHVGADSREKETSLWRGLASSLTL